MLRKKCRFQYPQSKTLNCNVNCSRNFNLQMKSVAHDHINCFMGACMDPPNICMLWAYCPKGALQVGPAFRISCFISDERFEPREYECVYWSVCRSAKHLSSLAVLY